MYFLKNRSRAPRATYYWYCGNGRNRRTWSSTHLLPTTIFGITQTITYTLSFPLYSYIFTSNRTSKLDSRVSPQPQEIRLYSNYYTFLFQTEFMNPIVSREIAWPFGSFIIKLARVVFLYIFLLRLKISTRRKRPCSEESVERHFIYFSFMVRGCCHSELVLSFWVGFFFCHSGNRNVYASQQIFGRDYPSSLVILSSFRWPKMSFQENKGKAKHPFERSSIYFKGHVKFCHQLSFGRL